MGGDGNDNLIGVRDNDRLGGNSSDSFVFDTNAAFAAAAPPILLWSAVRRRSPSVAPALFTAAAVGAVL